MQYKVKELKDMLKAEENYLKGLMRDVRFSEKEIEHLKECIRIAEGKEN